MAQVVNNMAIEWGWFEPPLTMLASQEQKMTAPLISAASREISFLTLHHELIRARLYSSFPEGSKLKVIWSIPATGETVFSWTETMPSNDWKWYQVWIGHLTNTEIYKAGTYKCEFFIDDNSKGSMTFDITEAPKPRKISGRVTITEELKPLKGAKITFGSKTATTGADGKYQIIEPDYISGPITCEAVGYKTIEFMITSPMEGTLTVNFDNLIEEKLTWWQRLLQIIIAPHLKSMLRQDTLFAGAYKAITGKDITIAEIEQKKLELMDWILPINIISKLITGKNLKGEPEEFGDSGDWLELIVMGVLLAIPGPLDDVGARAAGKAISKAEAAKLTAKLGEKATVTRLIKVVRKNPTSSAKLLSKFPIAVRDAVINGLGRTAYGREAIYILGKTNYFKYAAPGLKGFLAKMGKGPKWIITSVGFLAGYLTFANFIAWVGKEALVETLSFPIWALIESKDWQGVLDHIGALRKSIELADKAMLLTKPIPVIRDIWKSYIDNANTQADIYEQIAIDALAEVVDKGILGVTSNIDDSSIYIEGAYVGKTPYEKEMDVGSYHILVTKSGYTSDEKDINILKDMSFGFSAHIVLLEETASISVVSEPETGADVYIDDSLKPYKTNTTFEDLPLGTHKIRIFKSPYGNVVYDVSPEEIELNLTEIGKTYEAKFSLTSRELPPDTGNISITSSPTGASIWINDTLQTFKTNTVVEDYPIGPIEIKIEKEGYEIPDTISETLEAGEIQAIDFGVLTPLPAEKGKLIIDVSPGDVDVFSAGALKFHIDETGHYEEESNPGSYSYVFKKEGFYDQTKNFYITSLEEYPLEFSLSEILPNIGYLGIVTSPVEVDVSIALGYLGATDAEGKAFFELPPGYYLVTFGKDDYDSKAVTTYISKGVTSTIDVTLKPTSVPEPYVAPTPYYYEPTIPYVYENSPDYSYLYPSAYEFPEAETISPPTERELLINLETTDLLPFKGRIYSIAFLDLSDPTAEIKIAVSNDEDVLVNGFLDFFESENYTKLVGYNVAFDYRFIFAKMMKYRRPSKAWKDVELRDVMQIMQQVKEAFVFGYNKPGKLDEWGKELLGKGKYGAQDLMLKKYISGDFDYCRAFQNRQIELTKGLYDLARYCLSEGFISSPAPVPEASSPEIEVSSAETPGIQGQKICSVCKAYNPLSATTCEICGASI